MINLLLGPPGGGKSYEAVAFHVIPALSQGRKVITNLPLVLDNFPPEWRSLLDVRKIEGMVRPFSDISHFGDAWRHPQEGYGALYVIDECHYPFRRGKTPQAVQEWFSEHRHELCDVLLMSQSYGKIDKEICDMVQTLYRVKKAVAFGFNSKYIRKVYDGIQGDCVNTSTRTYEKRFFKYYRSHTKSSAAGNEQGANDIVPIWKRWPFLCAPIFLGAAALLFMRNGISPVEAMAPQPKGVTRKVTVIPGDGAPPGQQARARRSTPDDQVENSPGEPDPVEVVEKKALPHPFQGYALHVAGFLANKSKGPLYLFQVSQNGQPTFTIDGDQLAQAGYKVHRLAECIAKVTHDDGAEFYALCDSPKVGMSPGKVVPGSDKLKSVEKAVEPAPKG